MADLTKPNVPKGTKIFELTVIDDREQWYNKTTRKCTRTEQMQPRRLRKCLCSCGKFAYIPNYILVAKKTRSCGHIKEGPDYMSIVRKMKYNAAKHRKLNWNLTDEQALILIRDNCFYCGTAPSNVWNNLGINTVFYSGIDRLNSKLGYDELNCVSSCKICNIAKMNLSLDQFLAFVKKIYNNLNLENLPINCEKEDLVNV